MAFRASLRASAPCSKLSSSASAPLRVQRVAAPRSFALSRTYASGPTGGAHPPPDQGGSRSKGTSTALIASLAVLVTAGGAFALLGGDDKFAALGIGSTGANKLSGSKAKLGSPGLAAHKDDYQKVYNAIAEKLEHDPEYDDGHFGPVLVRLAWHASGTYDKNTGNGGSNGATMRFAPEADHGANAGLIHARSFYDSIHSKFPWITYSDLWTLGGIVAVQEMGGPTIPWRPGRKDGAAENCTPDGRLPDGDKGSDHLRHIFYKMGFNDQEIVALSGAHALGRCHKDRSGFDGPWTFSPTTFSNAYYQLLLDEKWNLRKWDGPIQYQDKNTKTLMMLTTDMALTTDKSFKPHVQRYAKSEEEFFKDFSKAYAKLLELGVPATSWQSGEHLTDGKHLTLKTTSDQGLDK
ncbi:cytochrome c peroxidase [Ceraceosorus bombacis]|uniref:Peroxidase n=1 Tax=Ceraceosorus bombacis TaxID=401625 RepID=A0A0N7LBI0_9BASI|nr:cytochrome c peroxidase [Ceraceosorus bombacis]